VAVLDMAIIVLVWLCRIEDVLAQFCLFLSFSQVVQQRVFMCVLF
jgi:hypothetical protein